MSVVIIFRVEGDSEELLAGYDRTGEVPQSVAPRSPHGPHRAGYDRHRGVVVKRGLGAVHERGAAPDL